MIEPDEYNDGVPEIFESDIFFGIYCNHSVSFNREVLRKP